MPRISNVLAANINLVCLISQSRLQQHRYFSVYSTCHFRVCAFTGNYFCEDCMSPEAIPIPARIIHNWDFKIYPVSQKAFNYIQEIHGHPTIDLKVTHER